MSSKDFLKSISKNATGIIPIEFIAMTVKLPCRVQLFVKSRARYEFQVPYPSRVVGIFPHELEFNEYL